MEGESVPGVASIDSVQHNEPTAIIPSQPQLDSEQTKRELVDPRFISKKIDPEGRSQTAHTILEARTNTRSTQENISDKERRVQQIAEQQLLLMSKKGKKKMN